MNNDIIDKKTQEAVNIIEVYLQEKGIEILKIEVTTLYSYFDICINIPAQYMIHCTGINYDVKFDIKYLHWVLLTTKYKELVCVIVNSPLEEIVKEYKKLC